MSDVLIVFDGITGESQDQEFPGAIDVISWGWGLSQSAPFGLGANAPARSGKPDLGELIFTHVFESATPILSEALVRGTIFPKVTLHQRRAGGKEAQSMLDIELGDALVTSLKVGNGGGDRELPTVTVSLAYLRIQVSYAAQDSKGAGKPTIEFNADVTEF